MIVGLVTTGSALVAYLIANHHDQRYAIFEAMGVNTAVVGATYVAIYLTVGRTGLSDLNLIEEEVKEVRASIEASSRATEVDALYSSLYSISADVVDELERSERVETVAQYLGDWLREMAGSVATFLSHSDHHLEVLLLDPRRRRLSLPLYRQIAGRDVGNPVARVTELILTDIERLFRAHDDAVQIAENANRLAGTLTISLVDEQVNYFGLRFDDRRLFMMFLPHFGETSAPGVSIDLTRSPQTETFWRRDVLDGLKGKRYKRRTEVTSLRHARKMLS